MKLAIIGANGRLGMCLVQQALTQEHLVVAVVRRPESLQFEHPRLSIAKADLLQSKSLEEAIHGCDAVLAAVAPKVKLRQRADMMSAGARNLCNAMCEAGVRRLLWVTSAGLDDGYVKAKAPFYKYFIRPLLLAKIYADFAKSEDIMEASPLDWTIVRPARLTDGALTRSFRVGVASSPSKAKAISRSDVADFMFSTVSARTHRHKKVIVAY